MGKLDKKSDKKKVEVTKKPKDSKKAQKVPKSSKEILAEATKAKEVKPSKEQSKKKVVETKKPANGKAKESSSEESSESSSEDEKPKAAQVKAAAPAKKQESSDSEDSSSSDSSDSEEEKPKAKPSVAKVSPKKKATPSSSSSSDSDNDDEPTTQKASTKQQPAKPSTTKKEAKAAPSPSSSSDSDSSESDSDDEKAVPKSSTVAKAESSSESSSSEGESDSSDSSDDSSESDADGDVKMVDAAETKVTNGATKRKAAEDDQPSAKKVKLTNGDAASADNAAPEVKSIFVGQLSWSIDNDRLAQEFAACGEIESATVQTDRNTGKSRGFGYVHFKTADALQKALEMNGATIDGREIKVDISTPRDPAQARQNRASTFGDVASPPSSTLFVGNLAFGTSEDSVWSFFNEYGVKSVRLPTDRETGRPKGFGYVEFEDIEGAKKAYEAHNGADLEGRNIRLDYSQPRDASGGGGRGGGYGGGRDFGGGRGGFDRGRGGRGRGGDRGRGRGRGGFDRGRGGFNAGRAKTGGIVTAFEGKKTTF